MGTYNNNSSSTFSFRYLFHISSRCSKHQFNLGSNSFFKYLYFFRKMKTYKRSMFLFQCQCNNISYTFNTGVIKRRRRKKKTKNTRIEVLSHTGASKRPPWARKPASCRRGQLVIHQRFCYSKTEHILKKKQCDGASPPWVFCYLRFTRQKKYV